MGFLEALRDVLWGPPLIVLILGAGSILTVVTKGVQFRCLGHSIKCAFTRDGELEEEGLLSPLEAVSIAIGGVVGVGNMGGVAGAITVGGPGALLWMWIAAFVGMVIKMAEVSLACYYRKTDERGESYGGPTYYMELGLGEDLGFKGWKPVALVFGLGFSVTAWIGLGNYNTASAVASTFDLPLLVPSVLYAVTAVALVLGGITVLGRIARILVPFVCLFYLACGLIILVTHAGQLPATLKMVVDSAFHGHAAIGGFGGAAFAAAVSNGFSRSVYSNEAGWGTSPMVHASAKTSHPIRQGMMGAFEVFTDTLVICTITALVLLVTGQWSSGVSGVALTLNAFECVMGRGGRVILTILLFFLGVTTSVGFYTYFEVLLRHACGGHARVKAVILKAYRVLYQVPPFLVTLYIDRVAMPPDAVWLFADLATGLPTFVNVAVVLALTPQFRRLLEDYQGRRLGKGGYDPDLPLFYEDKRRREASGKP